MGQDLLYAQTSFSEKINERIFQRMISSKFMEALTHSLIVGIDYKTKNVDSMFLKLISRII